MALGDYVGRIRGNSLKALGDYVGRIRGDSLTALGDYGSFGYVRMSAQASDPQTLPEKSSAKKQRKGRGDDLKKRADRVCVACRDSGDPERSNAAAECDGKWLRRNCPFFYHGGQNI